MLVVFDMDGTLLDAKSRVTPYTAQTLRLMRAAGIPYTVATGRTLQATRGPLADHDFALPHVVKNGAVIWCPARQGYSHAHLLTQQEVWHVIAAFSIHHVTPFVFTLERDNFHAVYHAPLKNPAEQRLAQLFEEERQLPLSPLSAMPKDARVINVSAMGPATAINAVVTGIDDEPHLVAYTGVAIEASNLCWVDIHHSEGSKANGINTLREDLRFDELIVFGDGENDLSMFSIATEAYAPENACAEIQSAATDVIGHHAEDGVAKFLRQRFNLRE